MQAIENKVEISWPTETELDTAGNISAKVYVLPAEEDENGEVSVFVHSFAGTPSTPLLAWHNRALCIASYGCDVVGESVLDWLKGNEGEIGKLAALYQGSELVGSDYKGRWHDDADDVQEKIFLSADFARYRDPSDWLQGETWESVAKDAKVDVDREDIDAINEIAEALDRAAMGEAHLDPDALRAHLADMRDEWREQRDFEACELCEFGGVEDPGEAHHTIFLHEAFGNSSCRSVYVCDVCKEQGAHDEREPNCQACEV